MNSMLYQLVILCRICMVTIAETDYDFLNEYVTEPPRIWCENNDGLGDVRMCGSTDDHVCCAFDDSYSCFKACSGEDDCSPGFTCTKECLCKPTACKPCQKPGTCSINTYVGIKRKSRVKLRNYCKTPASDIVSENVDNLMVNSDGLMNLSIRNQPPSKMVTLIVICIFIIYAFYKLWTVCRGEYKIINDQTSLIASV